MNPKQWQWLTEATKRIPALFDNVEKGVSKAETVLGERVINGKRVRLSLVVEVVDTGRNPLASHASANYPGTSPNLERPDTRHRRRTGPKRQ